MYVAKNKKHVSTCDVEIVVENLFKLHVDNKICVYLQCRSIQNTHVLLLFTAPVCTVSQVLVDVVYMVIISVIIYVCL